MNKSTRSSRASTLLRKRESSSRAIRRTMKARARIGRTTHGLRARLRLGRTAQARAAGWSDGWGAGYWYGQCEAIMQRTVRALPRFPMHLLFVATGKGFPYAPIDQAMIETLENMVDRLTVTDGNQAVSDVALAVRPDVVLVLDGIHFDTAHIDRIRAAGIRTAVWFTDDPYYTDQSGQLAQHYDVVFTLEQSCVPFYKNQGCPQVHYMPMAVHPGHFRPQPPSRVQREISFVGTAFWRRVELIDEIAPYLMARDTRIIGIWWDRLRNFEHLASKIDNGTWMNAAQTADVYAQSKIVINIHRAAVDPTFNSNSREIPAVSPNPRIFEIAASGTLLMTDARDALADFYVPEKEIVLFHTAQELQAKLDYYLHHEEERRAIALRGLYRTLRDHTYASRLEQLLTRLAQEGGEPG